MKFQDICLYETVKVAVSARVMSSNIRWRRILHEYPHVLRETRLNETSKSSGVSARIKFRRSMAPNLLSLHQMVTNKLYNRMMTR